jgi:chemotaxis receptor (MCP) glutamine deamidase CheD
MQDPILIDRQDLKDLIRVAGILAEILSTKQITKSEDQRLRYADKVVDGLIQTMLKNHQ